MDFKGEGMTPVEYQREYMRRRKEAGLCLSCGFKNDSDFVRCSICRAKAVENRKAKRAESAKPRGIDLTGKVFGRLRVICRDGDKQRNFAWLCVCACGNKKTIAGQSLRLGKTRSCGCLQSEMARSRMINKNSAVNADRYFERIQGDE